MKLLFLHGPPAVGKLTIAREVAARTGWRLFHNHLTVDLALSLYDFGTPGFIALREEVWLAGFRRALADGLPGVIFTFNPENSVPQRFIDELFAEIPARGGQLISVELTASESEIERRIDSASRREHRKLVDLALYRQLRGAGVFASPAIPRTDLSIDTEAVRPAEAAKRIAEFALAR
ncbi:MAG: shikimate kinase [Verrucomicrobiota bacterium]